MWTKWSVMLELILVSVVWSNYGFFYSLLDGMLVCRWATPSIEPAGTHLYTWEESSTVREQRARTQPNVPSKTQTQITQTRDKCTNHGGPVLPQFKFYNFFFSVKFCADFRVSLAKQVLSVTVNHMKSGLYSKMKCRKWGNSLSVFHRNSQIHQQSKE